MSLSGGPYWVLFGSRESEYEGRLNTLRRDVLQHARRDQERRLFEQSIERVRGMVARAYKKAARALGVPPPPLWYSARIPNAQARIDRIVVNPHWVERTLTWHCDDSH